MRMATASVIRSMGWNVLTFESAAAFLGSGVIGQTHCLISDVTMPGMSGIEMLAHLVSNGCAPPTIFLTGFPTAHDEALARANGALAYLTKPADFNVMQRSVQRALDKTGASNAGQ
ncbi:hypothetical protein LMG27952_02861 [Paraburkholderia hiiakae]|uniref:Response regulatory domain-containing protein n=2 Tax=Paraburkholderia hiiakae TaxID=1081782 RepID=A0ABM8NMY7_9BURK|nr:hypothetical protein LMG27952_02861 [Paraburkholderia hiiakae]